MNYIFCSYNKCADYAENTYFIGKYNDKARKYHNFLPELKRIYRKKKPGKIFQQATFVINTSTCLIELQIFGCYNRFTKQMRRC